VADVAHAHVGGSAPGQDLSHVDTHAQCFYKTILNTVLLGIQIWGAGWPIWQCAQMPLPHHRLGFSRVEYTFSVQKNCFPRSLWECCVEKWPQPLVDDFYQILGRGWRGNCACKNLPSGGSDTKYLRLSHFLVNLSTKNVLARFLEP